MEVLETNANSTGTKIPHLSRAPPPRGPGMIVMVVMVVMIVVMVVIVMIIITVIVVMEVMVVMMQ